MALQARSRTIRNPQLGQTVYYFRRGKGRQNTGDRGPARVIAVEPPTSDTTASSVIWLSHGAHLVRAAPEHLRVATPLETTVFDVIQGTAAPPGVVLNEGGRRTLQGRYIDLGENPTDHELREANQIDEPQQESMSSSTPTPTRDPLSEYGPSYQPMTPLGQADVTVPAVAPTSQPQTVGTPSTMPGPESQPSDVFSRRDNTSVLQPASQ